MPIDLWNDFFAQFCCGLRAVDPVRFLKAWDLEDERTSDYTEILCGVAIRMDLAFRREHSRIDYMMGKEHREGDRTPWAFVPSIAIESENEVMSAHKEVNYLHVINTPLKALITCALWTRSVSAQTESHDLLEHWRAIRRAHRAVAAVLQDDVFAVIVGENAKNGTSINFYLEILSDPAGSPQIKAFYEVTPPDRAAVAVTSRGYQDLEAPLRDTSATA